jgi:hypothetical protein
VQPRGPEGFYGMGEWAGVVRPTQTVAREEQR